MDWLHYPFKEPGTYSDSLLTRIARLHLQVCMLAACTTRPSEEKKLCYKNCRIVESHCPSPFPSQCQQHDLARRSDWGVTKVSDEKPAYIRPAGRTRTLVDIPAPTFLANILPDHCTSSLPLKACATHLQQAPLCSKQGSCQHGLYLWCQLGCAKQRTNVLARLGVSHTNNFSS